MAEKDQSEAASTWTTGARAGATGGAGGAAFGFLGTAGLQSAATAAIPYMMGPATQAGSFVSLVQTFSMVSIAPTAGVVGLGVGAVGGVGYAIYKSRQNNLDPQHTSEQLELIPQTDLVRHTREQLEQISQTDLVDILETYGVDFNEDDDLISLILEYEARQ